MKFRRKPRENVEINLASLIDVVFLIGLAWLLGLTQTPRVAHERRSKAPPRVESSA